MTASPRILPNATISVLSNDGATVKDAVVVLKSPKLDGDNLTFDVSVLEGDLTGATGAAALFIDWFAARGGGGRVWSAAVLLGMAPGTAIPALPSRPVPRSAPRWRPWPLITGRHFAVTTPTRPAIRLTKAGRPSGVRPHSEPVLANWRGDRPVHRLKARVKWA